MRSVQCKNTQRTRGRVLSMKKKTILWSDMNYLLIRNFLEYTKTSFYHPFCTQIITLRDENLLDRFFLFIISSGEMKIMKTFIDKVLNV